MTGIGTDDGADSVDASTGPVPVPAVVDEFLSWLAVERGRTVNTVRAYRRDLITYVEHLVDRDVIDPVSPGDLDDVSEDDIAAFVAQLSDLGRAPSTIARATVSVRSLHRFIAREHDDVADPSAGLDVPRVPRGLPRALSEDQVAALLASPVGGEPLVLRDRAILETLYGTGLRVSELVGLSLADVDLDSGLLRAFGKGRRERIVPLGRHAVGALGEWMSGAGRHAVLFDRHVARVDADAVFLNARGGRLSRQGAWLVIRRHGDRVGIEPGVLTPHVLRHSCATHMLDHGADIRAVQEMLGHVAISSTQRYTAVSQSRLRSVYDEAHPRAKGA